MKVAILGAGVLGRTYGGLLSLSGHDVHYLMRSDYISLQKEKFFTLSFENSSKTYKITDPMIYRDSQTLPPSDLIIITLKTSDNFQIGSMIKNCLKPNSIILIIQNGIGNEETVAQYVENRAIICGVSSMAAQRTSATQTQIHYVGQLRLAPYQITHQKSCHDLTQILMSSPEPLDVVQYENYKSIRWHKLAWNIPFGLLSIIFRLPTEVLAHEEPYSTLAQNIIKEVITVANSEGVLFSEDFMKKTLEVTKQVKNFFPSLYRDWYAGKTIEKEYILDKAINIATKNQVPIPLLTLLEKVLCTLSEHRIPT